MNKIKPSKLVADNLTQDELSRRCGAGLAQPETAPEIYWHPCEDSNRAFLCVAGHDNNLAEVFPVESAPGFLSAHDNAARIAKAIEERPALIAALQSALRYIEVQVAYQGAMTADQVEARIKDEYFPARVAIGANSCNTLASFDLRATRELLAKAKA